MTPADNLPDFDSMSPEEIQAWLETLAKRQGASSEEFLTEANMEVAEIDPDSVVIDEPGYVPYGQEAPEKPAPAAAPPPPPVPAPAPAPLPRVEMQPPPPPPIPPRPVQPLFVSEPEEEIEEDLLEDEPIGFMDEEITAVAQSSDTSALAWLESLAADQNDDLFNLDLDSIEEPAAEAPAASSPSLQEQAAWLEEMARQAGSKLAGELESPPPPAPPPSIFEAPSGDSMTWLESLAKRQGAPEDELTTSADLDIPELDESAVERASYTPFTFESPLTPRSSGFPGVPEPESSASETESISWLDSLASESTADDIYEDDDEALQGEADDLSLEAIRVAIERGTVTPDQMKVYLAHQAEMASEQEAEAERIAEMAAAEPPVPADIPDWLLESVGGAPGESQTPSQPERPPLESLFGDAPVAAPEAEISPDMPDWLKDETGDEASSIESIFAQTTEESAPEPITAPFSMAPMPDIDVDPNDPWVEAFDLEHEQGEVDIENVPEWYATNLSDPTRIAAVERMAGEEEAAAAPPSPLMDVALPDEEFLPEGEVQDIPAWLNAHLPESAAAETLEEEDLSEAAAFAVSSDEPAIAGDIPDWLRESQAEINVEEIPDWLKDVEEPVSADLDDLFFEEEAEITPPKPAAPAPAPAAAPKPQPTFVGTYSLESARGKLNTGDVDGGLAEYEAMIRANVAVDSIVEDLSAAVRQHRSNPAVYRVLGDGYMRQGKLQQALDIFREALNQL